MSGRFLLEEILGLNRLPKPSDTLIKTRGKKVLHTAWITGNWNTFPDGYQRAADKLVDNLEGWSNDDQLVFPVVFLYRHYVELKLKSIIIDLEVISRKPMPREQFTKHTLLQFWSYVKNNHAYLKNSPPEKKMMVELDRLINQLSTLDPDSMHFRYSHNKQLQRMRIPKALCVDNFKIVVTGIANALSKIKASCENELDSRHLEQVFQSTVEKFIDLY